MSNRKLFKILLMCNKRGKQYFTDFEAEYGSKLYKQWMKYASVIDKLFPDSAVKRFK